MVVRTPYGGGIKALEHHSESTEGYFIATPGLKVVIPSSPYDAKGLLTAAMRDPDPVLFFEPLRLYRAFREEIPDESYSIPLGKAKVVQEGSDITLIGWGSMLRMAVDAVKEFADSGEKTSVEIIDLRTLSPVDWECIHKSVQKTGRCVIVQEAPRTLGLASEICAQIVEKDLLSLKAPVVRVTGYDVIYPLFKLENYQLPNMAKVQGAIRKVMNF